MTRVLVVMFNTYREAVRARILHGLFGVAIATACYATIVGEFASVSRMRVVSDLGAASVALFGVAVSVILGATSLYRELELKTIFPILARPINRSEYVVGKYLGALLTLAVFVAGNAAVLLMALAFMSEKSPALVFGAALGSAAIALLVAWRVPRSRTVMPLLWAVVMLVVASQLAADAPDDRRVVLASALLTMLEVAVVTAVATVFSAFSSPFLTAVCTLGVFFVGRSADTLAKLPKRVFGEFVKEVGETLSHVVPNLMAYVPPRPQLTGEALTPLAQYVTTAALQSALWSAGLLAFAALIFRRRDFL